MLLAGERVLDQYDRCRAEIIVHDLTLIGAGDGRGDRLLAMTYIAADDRYEKMPFRRCGRSGINLPEVSLGLWQNFGDDRPLEVQRAILRRAFDLGQCDETCDDAGDDMRLLGQRRMFGQAQQRGTRVDC